MLPVVPQKPHPSSTDDHMTSHDSDSSNTLPTLSTALRLSIAGETLDKATEMQLGTGDVEEADIFQIPDDMPVDLRVKLAVSMIQLGRTVPEVGLLTHSRIR